MNNKEDKILDEYLKGDSELSRLYEEAKDADVPEYLDDAILAAAKLEVGSKPVSSLAPFSSSWQMPLSLAAVLVLSVGLVLSLYDERGESYLKEPLSTTDVIESQAASPEIETELIKTEQKNIRPAKEMFEQHEEKDGDSSVELQGIGSMKNNLSAKPETVEELRREVEPIDKIKEDKNKGRADIKLEETGYRAIYSDEAADVVELNEDRGLEDQLIEESYAPKVEKPSRLYNDSKNQRIEELEEEVEELNQAHKEISSERDQLKQEIETIKSRQILLKKKISRKRLPSSIRSSPDSMNSSDDVSDMKAADSPMEEQAWLENILFLWNENRKEDALQQLQEFRQMYPEFQQSELDEILPEELIQTVPQFE